MLFRSAVSFAIDENQSDPDVATISGSTLSIVGPGSVTVVASQSGGVDPSNSNVTYSAAESVARSFSVISIGKGMALRFDQIGTMGASQTFKVRAVLMDTETGKPVRMAGYFADGGSITYSITGRTDGGSPSSGNLTTADGFASVTTGSSAGTVTIRAYATGGGYEAKQTSISVSVDASKTGQKILVKEGEDAGGLRDLPISRRPIPVGLMFRSTSDLPLTFTLSNNSSGVVKIVDGQGADAKLAFATASDGFSGFSGADEITFDLTVSQAGNGTYHAAQSVTRTIKIKKPSKSVFFEERKSDARYDEIGRAHV